MNKQLGDPGYKHPKCYANLHGGCSSAISGEHYISHSLIRLYSFEDAKVRVKPTPNYRIPVSVLPKKFVANVLCAAHNSLLSPADVAALQFATFLRGIAIRYANGGGEWGEAESITISGDDFQRWALKLLITHAAADVYTMGDGDRVSTLVSDDAINLLLDKSGWPITWGLGVTGNLSNPMLSHDPFSKVETVIDKWWSVQPFILHEPKTMIGGIVDLAGVSFTLCVFNQSGGILDTSPGNPLFGVEQRPESLSWVLDGVPKTVVFEWSDPYLHRPVTFTMRRTPAQPDVAVDSSEGN